MKTLPLWKLCCVLGAAMFVCFMIACGGDDDDSDVVNDSRPSHTASQQEAAYVNQISTQLTSLQQAAGGETGLEQASTALNIGPYQGLLSLNMASSMGAYGRTKFPVPLPPAYQQGTTDPNCVTATETKVTYTNCDYSGMLIDGYIEASGEKIGIDLTYTFTDASTTGTGKLTYKGDMTVTTEKIAGYLDLYYDITSAGMQYVYDLKVTYGDVLFSSTCTDYPTGGYIDIKGGIDYMGQNIDSHVTVIFNAECGKIDIKA
jgi:hypothetical protein